MKTLLYSALLMILSFSALFADEIHLNDLKIIKCRIIQITDENIEYIEDKEEGGRPFVTVKKSLVAKVVYDDGRVVQVAGKTGPDKIFLRNGSIIEGKVLQVTPDVIIYSAQGSDKKEAVVRGDAVKIVYPDGEEVQISESPVKKEEPPAAVQNEPEPVEQEAVTHSGGFIDSVIRIGLVGGFGFIWGDIHNKENDALDRAKRDDTITHYDVYSDNEVSTMEHYRWYGGFELGFLFPAIKFQQTRAFGLSGIKFGLIGNYVFSYGQQDLRDDSLDEDSYTNVLMKYRTVNAGPEMNLILSPRSNKVNLVFRFYLLGGYIHHGKLEAVPGLRDVDLSVSKYDYSTSFKGYSATAGAGIRFVSNMAFPVITGLDLAYTYSKIEFGHALPVYNGADNTSFHEISFGASFGIHI